MPKNWIAVSVLALAAAVAPSAAPQSQDGVYYVITGSAEGTELAELVATAAGITGEPYFVEPGEVRNVRVHIDGKRTVPRAKFMSFMDSCFRSVGFAHVEVMEAGVRTHRLVRLDGQHANLEGLKRLKSMAPVIEPSELPALADRWTLITTTYTCRNLPAWELVTTLQPYFADAATEAIRTIEGTDFVVMTGPAAHVASIVLMCERLDREATETRHRTTGDLEKRLAALEAAVAELAPDGK